MSITHKFRVVWTGIVRQKRSIFSLFLAIKHKKKRNKVL